MYPDEALCLLLRHEDGVLWLTLSTLPCSWSRRWRGCAGRAATCPGTSASSRTTSATWPTWRTSTPWPSSDPSSCARSSCTFKWSLWSHEYLSLQRNQSTRLQNTKSSHLYSPKCGSAFNAPLLEVACTQRITCVCRAAKEKDHLAGQHEREAGKLHDLHARKQQGLSPIEAELENLRRCCYRRSHHLLAELAAFLPCGPSMSQ